MDFGATMIRKIIVPKTSSEVVVDRFSCVQITSFRTDLFISNASGARS
jgi:hypothetical protein